MFDAAAAFIGQSGQMEASYWSSLFWEQQHWEMDNVLSATRLTGCVFKWVQCTFFASTVLRGKFLRGMVPILLSQTTCSCTKII